MIVMMIADPSVQERNVLHIEAKRQAAINTEERWDWVLCGSVDDVKRQASAKRKFDLACLDITMKGALDVAKAVRKLMPMVYMILIADTTISPVLYLKPTIGPESLLLKPLSKQSIHEVLTEAITTFAQRFIEPDTTKVFVLDVGGERTLVDYGRIYYFEAREKKVFLNDGTKEYGFNDTLENLENSLQGEFIRCHRAFLLNKKYIEQIYVSQSRIILKDGIEVPLSRKYKPLIKDYLEQKRRGR